MRLALFAALALASACSKPPQGLFVDEKSGARLYKEGDNLFLEYFALEYHLKPQLTARLDRSGDAWTSNVGVLGTLAATPTDTGIAITAAGEKHSLRRVESVDAQPPSVEVLEALVRSFLLDQVAEFERTKHCSLRLLAKDESPERIATTGALVRDATLVAAATPIADRSSRWADEYEVTGTIAFAPMDFAEGQTLLMVSTKAETIPFAARATLSRFAVETKRAPGFVMKTFGDTPASRTDVCGLTRRPALQYATSRLGE